MHRPALIAALLLTATVAALGFSQSGRGEKYAFLLASSKYNSTQLRDLPFTIEEIEDFRKALVKTGFADDNILLLHDKADRERLPEKAKIERQFRLLLNGLQSDDTVIVAINGHGVHYKGDKSGFYCPLGADINDKNSLVPMDFFYDLLKKSKARQKLMIVQACQNDPFHNQSMAAERLEFAAKNDDVPEGIAAIFSCMEGQKSYYDPDHNRGLFFNHVIRSWNGEYLRDGDKVLTLEDFFFQVRVKTKADALKFKGGVEQVPEIRREYKGEWIVAKVAVDIPKQPKIETQKPPEKIPAENNAAKRTKGEVITNSIGMKLAYIPAGKFMMGSPASEKERRDDELQHEVQISKPFYMGVYAVTQEEYEKVMETNPSYFRYNPKGKDKQLITRRSPVESVSWNEAKEFCRKLSTKDGKTYRLPSEAEWEYACRAGTTTPFFFGQTISTDQANYNGNYAYGNGQKGVYRDRTTEVGSFPPNAFGLYDMHGNVWQWCEDRYDANYYQNSPKVDPLNSTAGEYHVLRGGSWGFDPGFCRSACRLNVAPDNRIGDIGFRVVFVLP